MPSGRTIAGGPAQRAGVAETVAALMAAGFPWHPFGCNPFFAAHDCDGNLIDIARMTPGDIELYIKDQFGVQIRIPRN